MKYETVRELNIPKIGFGCYRIGGDHGYDPNAVEPSIQALRSALELGYTHFDTAEGYAAGHSEELVGQVVREMGVPREKLFITTKVSPDHLEHDQVLRACEGSLRRLGMDYIDLYLIHWPQKGMNLADTFKGLNRLVREGKVRHLGVSNFSVKLMQESMAVSETPLLTNQVSYSLPDRRCVADGTLEFCRQNDILLTAYSPVVHRATRGSRALKQVAAARGVTTFQVALAWLVMQPRVITIPNSGNPQHQKDNLAAAELELSEEEMQLLWAEKAREH